MKRKVHAFTLIELLYAAVLSSLLVGSTTSLLYFVSRRIGVDAANAATTTQANDVVEDISRGIGQATACYAYPAANYATTGHAVLDCVQPSLGTDRVGEGILESVAPTAIENDGTETFSSGNHIYFYFSDQSGTLFGANGFIDGSLFWRAVGPISNPIADSDWSLTNGSSRWPLIENFTVINSPLARSTTISITASSLARRFATAGPAERPQELSRITIVRTILWRSLN